MRRKDPRHLMVAIAKLLSQLKIPYLVTGGIALAVWGRPRFTADIDIAVEVYLAQIEKLIRGFKSLGKTIIFDEEAIREAVTKLEEFNLVDGETGIKIDFWILNRNDSFDLSRLKRKKIKKVLGEKINLISPEDLILTKLKWYQESKSTRQLEDVKSILKISGDLLDINYLKKWTKILGCHEVLDKFK